MQYMQRSLRTRVKVYTVFLCMYSRGPKKFTFRLCRTVEKRSVPFPLYGQPFLGTLFVRSENGYEYGRETERQSEGSGSQSMARKRPVQDDEDQ